jgi:hypothetical protein
MDQSVADQEPRAAVAPANPKSRLVLLITLLNVILLGGLLYKMYGEALPSTGGVTLDLINHMPGPMLDVEFEYPGGKLALARIEARGDVGHSVTDLDEFEATLSFKDEQGHSYRTKVPVQAYGGLLALLAVQPILETTTVKTAEGKEEAVVKASPDKVFVVRSYQKPGLGK